MKAWSFTGSLRYTTLIGRPFQSTIADGKEELKKEEYLQLIRPGFQELSRRADVHDGGSSKEPFKKGA